MKNGIIRQVGSFELRLIDEDRRGALGHSSLSSRLLCPAERPGEARQAPSWSGATGQPYRGPPATRPGPARLRRRSPGRGRFAFHRRCYARVAATAAAAAPREQTRNELLARAAERTAHTGKLAERTAAAYRRDAPTDLHLE